MNQQKKSLIVFSSDSLHHQLSDALSSYADRVFTTEMVALPPIAVHIDEKKRFYAGY